MELLYIWFGFIYIFLYILYYYIHMNLLTQKLIENIEYNFAIGSEERIYC